MAPTVQEATKKASEAIAGSAAKEFKRESGTARLLGAGNKTIQDYRLNKMLMKAQLLRVSLN